MKVLILPISGGGFPVQLGILSKLCDAKYEPDLVLSSSGGNVSAYIAAAGGWQSKGIKRVAKCLSKDFFLTSWTEGLFSFIPSWIPGFFMDSFFNSSTLGIEFFKENFNSVTATHVEIWTGTVDCTSKKSQLFCNRKYIDSCIYEEKSDKKDGVGCLVDTIKDEKSSTIPVKCIDCKIDTQLYGCLEPIYLNGNVEEIGKAALASASIPTMVPSQNIRGKLYADGGVTHASPLSIMKDVINNLEEKRSQGLHLTYVNSFDLEKSDPVSPTYMTSLHNGKITMLELVQNLAVQDRIAGIDLIRNPDIKMYSLEGFINNSDDIEWIETRRLKCRRSFIEYYPVNNDVIDLKSFKNDDVLKLLEESSVKFKYRLRWVGSADIFEKSKVINKDGK
ncbi:MAG: patatin-like phospholipase [Solumvirus sp.]|uniref:Patatin-like phospholipase n=1 Tax=Solumvirus sp. TaxID=2487773 RepID=A0A3G5AGU4_9VIRU|nr:MAG: patatin-like phospholipase [Solumvirus sp.]